MYRTLLFQNSLNCKILNKMRKYSTILLLFAIVFAFSSCGDKKAKEFKRENVDPRMEYGTNFLDCLKNRKYDEAFSQLYDLNLKDTTVVPLSSERKAELLENFKTFPVNNYSIKEVLLYSDIDTEVRYDIELFKKEKGDDRPNTIQGVLNPFRVKGRWFLTISKKSRE